MKTCTFVRLVFALCGTWLLLTAAVPDAGNPPSREPGPISPSVVEGPSTSLGANGSAPDAGMGAKSDLNISLMSFSRENIRKVMSHHQGQIEACYNETLANREKVLEGHIVVTFIITPEGLVKKPAIRKKGTTLGDPQLHDCVISVVTSISFPKPPDGRDHPIEYPLNLKAHR